MTLRILPIAGFPVMEATPAQLATRLLSAHQRRQKITLLFANSNFIVKCKRLLHLMWDDHVIIVNDGVGMDIAARILHGKTFKANLNGTDFTPYLFRESVQPLKVFMYGGKPDVVQKAAAHVSKHLGQNVVGYQNGYAAISDVNLVKIINDSGAEVLLVALGNPLQEEWILRNRNALNASIVSGVGALFDFWAGDKPRAPDYIKSIRLEWLYRLYLEPRRLFRRYTVEMLYFFMACFKQQRVNRIEQKKVDI